MDAAPGSNDSPHISSDEPPAPFASGTDTKLRTSVAKFGAWLFSPPYLPGWSVAFALLCVVFQCIFILMQQTPEYWIDPQQALKGPLISIPLTYGPWIFLAGYLALIVAIGLVLSILNRVAGLMAWIAICMTYLDSIVGWGWCGFRPLFILKDREQCRLLETGLGAAVAVGLGIALAVSIQLLRTDQEGPHPRAPYKALTGASMVLLLLTSFGTVHTATLPKPEWRLIQSAYGPTARTAPALAYDSKRKTAVLFGGASSWTAAGAWIGLGDTWEWNGAEWRQAGPAQSPPARTDAAMAYDAKRGVSVLFGGQDQDSIFGDTWEWDGQNWAQAFPKTSPPARCSYGMYYDTQRQKVVIYGGFARQAQSAQPGDKKDVFFDDAWEWDGLNWSRIEMNEARASDVFGITFDEARQLPVLMDGAGLWYWQDQRWKQHDPSSEPSGRWNGMLAYDRAGKRVVLFGGHVDKKNFSDTWAFDGQLWKSVVTAEKPAARYASALFYDEQRRSLLMFGGFDGTSVYGDTWELRLP